MLQSADDVFITYTDAKHQKTELPFFTEARSITSVLNSLNFDAKKLGDFLDEVVAENKSHPTDVDPIYAMLGAMFQAVTSALVKSMERMDSDGSIKYTQVLDRYLGVAYDGVAHGIDLLDLVDAIAHVHETPPEVVHNTKANLCV